jgi:hypothetical protein
MITANPVTLVLIGLRSAALGLELQGQGKTATSLYTLSDAIEAGKNVDEHMQAVADKLKDRSATDEDWADVTARIEADSARLQGA